jgi:putative nucleotidyltransferase with HDIG domain
MSSAQDPTLIETRLTESVEQGHWTVPELPESTRAVLEACVGQEESSRSISLLIAKDPVLSKKVLHLANSAMWTPTEPIHSMSDAVSRLGYGAVANVAIAIALRGRLFAQSGYESRLAALWSHSLLVAAWAAEIARRRKVNAESAFLTALLHDVGKPVVLSEVLRIAKHEGESFKNRALENWMTDHHARVGADCVRRWGFPESMATAIAQHHLCARGEDEYFEDTYVLGLADRLGHILVPGTRMGEWSVRRRLHGHNAVEALGITGDVLGQLLERQEDVIQAAQAFG